MGAIITSDVETINGQQVGGILVNGTVVIRVRFATVNPALTAVERAQIIAGRLQRLVDGGLLPANVIASRMNNEAVVVAVGSEGVHTESLIMTADALHAQANNSTPDSLAALWASQAAAALTAAANPVTVPLGMVANRAGIVNDGTAFNTGGLDAGGSAYSGNLLAALSSWRGMPFVFGVGVNVAVAVRVPLPVGKFAALALLAAGVNGGQPNQKFTVSYADGSSWEVVLDVSDWFTPRQYPGESVALAMPYRNLADGTKDMRPFNLYGYVLVLDPLKIVQGLVLPANANVVLAAVTLSPTLPLPQSMRIQPLTATVPPSGTQPFVVVTV